VSEDEREALMMRHQTEMRLNSETSGEEKTLKIPWRKRITANSAKTWSRLDWTLVVAKLKMKWSPYRPSRALRNVAHA